MTSSPTLRIRHHRPGRHRTPDRPLPADPAWIRPVRWLAVALALAAVLVVALAVMVVVVWVVAMLVVTAGSG